ncbi:MAG: glycosyltransferase [Patescibacteria group bacterium]
MTKKILISIVSPAFNESRNISRIVAEVDRIMSKLKKFNYEYIFVDDGSNDNTWQEIVKVSDKNKHIKGIRFTRNFGQQIAITAGIDIAKGEALIYCDSDLQHPPSLFPKLINEWTKGSMIVHTKRLDTEGISFFKNLMSKFFYLFANALSDTKVEDGMADFKLLDKKVYLKLRSMKEKNRFLRGMVSWLGYKSSTVNYQARKRMAGKAWYNFSRNLEFAKIGLLSLSTKPLKYILNFGLLLIFISTISIVSVMAVIIYEWNIRYFSPTIILVIFNTLLIGFVIACLGIVAIYISYLYKEIIKRPTYLISEKINLK